MGNHGIFKHEPNWDVDADSDDYDDGNGGDVDSDSDDDGDDVVMKDLCCLGETLLSRRSQLQGFPVEFLLKRPTEQPERNQGVSCRR